MNDEKEKQSFVIYRNWMEMVMALPDYEALDLTRTIFAYCLKRDYEPDPTAAAIFDTFEPLLERDIEKWYRTRAERVKAGSLGGKQKVANAKQVLADAKQNEAVYVNVNVNENVNGTVDVNDNVLDKSRDKKEDANASKKEIVDALVAKWNSYADRGNIPLVRSVSRGGKTWKSVLARVGENGIDDAVEVMDAVFGSPFLKGENNNGWCAKFDWMFLPSNYEKIKNGNYNGRKTDTDRQADILRDWMNEREETKPIW